MRYLATASGPAVRAALDAGALGYLHTPGGNRLRPGWVWAADNGCFSGRITHDRWATWLEAHAGAPGSLFAVVPDVVADHDATLSRWRLFSGFVRGLGYRPAFVLQDGVERPGAGPPDDADCLFVGGSTRFKLSAAAAAITASARRAGAYTHLGRVNTRRRILLAAREGYDSVDGTRLAFGPEANLGPLLRWLAEAGAQTTLDGVL